MTKSPDRPQAVAGTGLHSQSKALVFDYRQAVSPVRRGLSDPISYHQWGSALHSSGPSAVLPLELSAELGASGPATSPALAAHFIRILAGEGVKAAANATSSLFYVMSGSGRCERSAEGSSPASTLSWQQGDLFVLPAGGAPLLHADSTAVLYWVHDAPLLDYLGVVPNAPRFETTHYPGDWLQRELAALASDPSSASSNRISLLLANQTLPNTRTVTHVLWAMFGMVPAGATQAPHRHQSVALDLIIDCDPGCYTLVGTELNSDGTIRTPRRIDWESGGAFITPPGHWHAHVNSSGRTAYFLPIQDAGLHTYLRSLDIRFSS